VKFRIWLQRRNNPPQNDEPHSNKFGREVNVFAYFYPLSPI
jgi:hypothetical protein